MVGTIGFPAAGPDSTPLIAFTAETIATFFLCYVVLQVCSQGAQILGEPHVSPLARHRCCSLLPHAPCSLRSLLPLLLACLRPSALTRLMSPCAVKTATVAKLADKQYFGLAIGYTVAAMAVGVAPLSGGAINPAVGMLGRVASGRLFALGERSFVCRALCAKRCSLCAIALCSLISCSSRAPRWTLLCYYLSSPLLSSPLPLLFQFRDLALPFRL